MAEYPLDDFFVPRAEDSPPPKRSHDWRQGPRQRAVFTRRAKRSRTDPVVEFSLDTYAPQAHTIDEINLHNNSLSSQAVSVSLTGPAGLIESFSSWYTQAFPDEEVTVVINDPLDDDYGLVGQVDEEDIGLVVSKRGPCPSYDPLHAWKDFVDVFLDEFIALEGRGEFLDTVGCTECLAGHNKPVPVFRCVDCFTDRLFCKQCIVTLHHYQPFHRVERWEEAGFFLPDTLKNLGLRIQLGHPIDHQCPLPERAKNDSFTIIDTSGIHEVRLDFCNCAKAEGHVLQLLKARLFPATVDMPATAATFAVLKHFQLLSYESKASAYQYWRTIVRETNNIDEDASKFRYPEFLRMTREFDHLLELKRAGRGHDILGAQGTQEGECAVLCPACPQPGLNLPEGWQDAPEDVRWVYILFIALDANFRLRCKLVSNEVKDPALSQGFGYFVKTDPYLDHLEKQGGVKQPRSTCVSHDAVNDADTKDVHGCSVSGLGAVDCSRHDFRRPNSVGDLQKGERYINMDYIFHSSLRTSRYPRMVVSYDIACQWGIHLHERMLAKFPDAWFIDTPNLDITLLVPKFHLPAHIEKCHRDFSFNLTKNVGRTDGEAPERGWAKINGLASSTREMGPGARRDKIESHMGDDNWKKTIGMGRLLYDRMKAAIPEKNTHAGILSQLESVVPMESINRWHVDVIAWERDRSQPNPYEPRVKDMVQADVRLLLAKQDAELAEGNGVTAVSGITGSSMITMGLELEELQRRLRDDTTTLGLHPTALQQAKAQERVNALRRRITAWYEVQALHIPGTTLLRTLDERRRPGNSGEIKVYDMRLWLPSNIGSECECDRHLQESEWLLREAQAKDALHTLRSHLRIESYVMKHKRDWVRGVRENTRSQTLVARNRARVKAAVEKYRTARIALQQLAKQLRRPDSTLAFFKELKDSDIHPLSVLQAIGEGHQQLSWFWLADGVTNDSEDPNDHRLQDALRIQWLRARARVMRWDEEIILLQEEMRRVVAFLYTQAACWEERAFQRSHLVNAILNDGLHAYASNQAWIRRDLAHRFQLKWSHIPKWIKTGTIDNDDNHGNSDGDDGRTKDDEADTSMSTSVV